MREHDNLRTDLIWHEPQRPLGGESARLMNDQDAEAKQAARKAKDRRLGRLLVWVVSRTALAALVALAILAGPVTRVAAAAPPPTFGFGVSVAFGPPPLPYYAQPLCPGPGYIWTPGYWAWDPAYGYYWVPGTWVIAPFVGTLWTPGYWGWDYDGDDFVWYPGYWGPVVGFYGGIDYGYGYTGYGYEGGYWRRDAFYYNRAVNNVRVTNITDVYNRTVVNNFTGVSYNGGNGGTSARATSAQMAAYRRRRFGPVGGQTRQIELARKDPQQRAAINHGAPRIAATPRPGVFKGRGVVVASTAAARYNEPPISRAKPHQVRAERTNPAQAGWRSFGNAPERKAPPERGRAQQQPPRGHYQRQAPPSAYRQPMERQQARPQRQGPPPRAMYRAAPQGRGNAGHPQGRGGDKNPHGGRG